VPGVAAHGPAHGIPSRGCSGLALESAIRQSLARQSPLLGPAAGPVRLRPRARGGVAGPGRRAGAAAARA